MATDNTNSMTFAQRLDHLKSIICSDDNMSKFKAAAAEGVVMEQYLQSLWNACRNPNILDCTVASLCQALMDSVTLGLRIGGPQAYGYIVPRKREAQFQAGYKGLLKLAYNDARATTAAAEVVRGKDHFNYELGTTPYVRHEIDSAPDDEILYAWASISVVQGPPFVKVWPSAYLIAHAEKYIPKVRSTGKWSGDALVVTNYAVWCQKTMLRMALKLMPMSETARRVLDAEEYADEGIDPEPAAMESGDMQETKTLREVVTAAKPLA